MRLLKTICLLIVPVLLQAQHPITFFTRTEATDIKNKLGRYPLLDQSYSTLKKQVDEWLDKDVDVPFPKDPAGGYTHDRHKNNYMLMFNSGILYNLTGNTKYATLVKKMLLKYAALNPTLKNHPEATSSSPGHLFWQALNDANWLVYTGMAYDLVYNALSAVERKTIESGAFKPEVDFITKDLRSWFNLIHNHGVWACAGVGITGIATHNKEYVDMALYGTARDGKSGFIAQMDNLFSPDGYYTEGPYYVRYAILPFYIFANALNHARPELKIFEHRDRILQKALLAGLQQTNLDGSFFPLNDAIKDKDYTSNEVVTAVDIAWAVYGNDKTLLPVVKKQNTVLLSKGGASLAATIAGTKQIPSFYSYHPAEYTDGAKGDEGGISLLRTGKDAQLTTLIFKYASHGLSHGHFDELNINLFDKGNEVITDYGSARFVGVEQKYGGRYLPENKTYAGQTIAHNTLAVDESNQYDGQEKKASRYHAEKLFSNISNPLVQVTSARDDNAYDNLRMQRTVYLLQLPGMNRVVVDLFNVSSADSHQYDLPFQYEGQVINTSFKYTAFTKSREQLGKKNGYQFLWKEAEALAGDSLAQFTFLNNGTYYTLSSLTDNATQLLFARTGANDPDFNLRSVPSYIIRKKGTDQSFVNVIEIHGNYDPVTELSTGAYPSVKQIRLLQNDKHYTVAEILMGEKKLMITQCNEDFAKQAVHSVAGLQWTGPCAVFFEGKNMLK